MEVLFLGTAAAEGWPALFCRCDACQRAKELGGKNIRTRSSLQLGDRYKVDFPPDSYFQMLKYGLSYANLEHLFITHAHEDHLYPVDLGHRTPPSAYSLKKKLHIYGNQLAHQWIKQRFKLLERQTVFKLVKPFETFQAGELEVTPIEANHSPKQTCLNYIFKVEGKSILQGFDTGWYPDQTWRKLADWRFDVVIMDCTNGGVEKNIHPQNHLGVKSLIEVKKRMEKMGILASDCRFIATHFSHGGGFLHHELEQKLNLWGIKAAYDGMKLKI